MVPFVALGAGTAAAQAGAAPPGTSGAVEREQVVFAFAYVDADAGLVALGGPPAEEGCSGLGFDDVGAIQHVSTGSGPVVELGMDPDQPMSVYAGTSIEDVCGRLVAGEPVELLASGTVRVILTDNDGDVSGTRANTFQNRAVGRLQTLDGGACHFQASFHAQVDTAGDFRVLRDELALRC